MFSGVTFGKLINVYFLFYKQFAHPHLFTQNLTYEILRFIAINDSIHRFGKFSLFAFKLTIALSVKQFLFSSQYFANLFRCDCSEINE